VHFPTYLGIDFGISFSFLQKQRFCLLGLKIEDVTKIFKNHPNYDLCPIAKLKKCCDNLFNKCTTFLFTYFQADRSPSTTELEIFVNDAPLLGPVRYTYNTYVYTRIYVPKIFKGTVSPEFIFAWKCYQSIGLILHSRKFILVVFTLFIFRCILKILQQPKLSASQASQALHL
jgi:hypothetical protein